MGIEPPRQRPQDGESHCVSDWGPQIIVSHELPADDFPAISVSASLSGTGPTTRNEGETTIRHSKASSPQLDNNLHKARVCIKYLPHYQSLVCHNNDL